MLNSAICASYFMNVFTALKGTFFLIYEQPTSPWITRHLICFARLIGLSRHHM